MDITLFLNQSQHLSSFLQMRHLKINAMCRKMGNSNIPFFDGQIELDPVPFRSTTKLCIAQMELKINIDLKNIVSGSGEP